MRKHGSLLRKLTLMLPTLLLAACVTPSANTKVVPAQRPALPAEAQPPKKPEICSETCSKGLANQLQQFQDSLTKATTQP